MVHASTAVLLCQFPLALGGLLAAMFYPSEGSAAVLLAPAEQTPVAAIEWARAHRAPILGLSADGTSPVVRMAGAASAIDALRAGLIPVAADPATCGTSPQSKGFRK